MEQSDIQRLRTLAEVAAAGDGHRPRPCPICDLAQLAEKAADELDSRKGEEPILHNLPVYLNLGDTRSISSVIGRADAFQDKEKNTTRIEILLDTEASQRLGDLATVFNLYALGFAGIAPSQERGT